MPSRSLIQTIVAGLCLLPFSFAASALHAQEPSEYPYSDPLLATLTHVLLIPEDYRPQIEKIRLLPERREVPIVGKRSDYTFSVYLNGEKRPLIILLAGLGSHFADPSSVYKAEIFYKAGFNVLSLSSTMNWEFAIGASHTGTPGFLPDDSRDLYSAMTEALNYVKTKYRIQPPAIGLAGFSLGGINSAFLSKIDEEEKKIGFDRVLMMDTPTDIIYAVGTLDQFYSAGAKWGTRTQAIAKGKVLKLVAQFLKARKKSPNPYLGLDRELNLSADEIRFLIGEKEHKALSHVILASQQIKDRGILKEPPRFFKALRRLREASHYGFIDFMKVFLLPDWMERKNIQEPADQALHELIETGQIRSITEHLRTRQTLFVVENADDPLLAPGQLDYLRETLGERLTTFPRGGHGGNFWHEPKQREILRIMAPLAVPRDAPLAE